jgi:hypothetical protein
MEICTKSELHAFCPQITIIDSTNVGIVGFNATNVNSIVAELENRIKTKSLTQIMGKPPSIEEKGYTMLKDKVWIVNPMMHLMAYRVETRKKTPSEKSLETLTSLTLSNGETLFPKTKDAIIDVDSSSHDSFWRDISKGEKEFMNLIKWYIEMQKMGDIIRSPTPYIKKDSPLYMFEIWKKIVRTTSTAAASRKKSSSIDINLDFSVFHSRETLDRILSILFDEKVEMEIGDCKLVFLSIRSKSGNPTDLFDKDILSRQNLKYLLLKLASYSQVTGRAIILCHTDSLGLFSIGCGTDGFIEPLNGNCSDFRFSPKADKHGGYYCEDEKITKSWDSIGEEYAINRKLPCHRTCCRHINQSNLPDLKIINENTWNFGLRRLHRVVCRNGEISQCHQEITNKTIKQGMHNIIQNSNMKNFLDLTT